MRRSRYRFCAVIAFILVALQSQRAFAQDGDYWVYFGTYTGFKYVRRIEATAPHR